MKPKTKNLKLILLVFALAFIPRALSLGAFLTADEDDQLLFAAQFLTAMLHKDWAGALVLGYPGVPTLATGALGLWLRYRLDLLRLPAWTIAPVFQSPVAQPLADLPYHIYLPLVQNAPPPLQAMLASVQNNPLHYLPLMRLVMVTLASLSIVLIFVMLQSLISPKPALLATLLIAFDPFFLANTRILHVDAPLTYFMFAAFLAFLLYLKGGRWGWLLASGVLGALAILSKTAGGILAPVLALGGALYAVYLPPPSRRKQRLTRLLGALVVWVAVAALAFFVLWPSMWGRPLFALTWIINNAKGALNTVHPSSGLFWGKLVTDRSPWYYLVALPFSLTPLTTIGALLSPVMVWLGFKDRRRGRNTFAARQLPLLLANAAYIIIFFVIVSFVSRRGVRYLLPLFPALDLLAALTLWSAVGRVKGEGGRMKAVGGRRKDEENKHSSFILHPSSLILHPSSFIPHPSSLVLPLLVAAQALSVLLFHPYYFDYFNPLLGGGQTAPDYVVIGWGEGMDQAARYLNQKPDVEKMTVAAWYSWQFANYFDGETIDLADNAPAYTADYTVFYINQVQRRFPSEELLAYFEDRLPEKVITLNGIDYAWIYPGPIIGQTVPDNLSEPLNISFGNAVTLLGLDAVDGRTAGREGGGASPLSTAYRLPVTLYWQVNAPLPPDLNVSLRVVDEDGVAWGQVDRLPIGGLVRTNKWQSGDVIRDEYLLPLDPAAPPGSYTFDILLYNFNTGEIFGQASGVGGLTFLPDDLPRNFETLAKWNASQSSSLILHPSAFILSPSALKLLGYTPLLTQTLPGYKQTIKLYWQATKALQEDYAVTFIARPTIGGEARVLLTEIIGSPAYPTSQWKKDQIVAEAYALAFPPDASPGEYEVLLEGGRQKAEGGNKNLSFSLGKITLLQQPHVFDLPPETTPVNAVLGAEGEVKLLAYRLLPQGELTLYWQPTKILYEDYKVFVHLTDVADAIIAQRDSIPANGARPTTTWLPGEIISDSYTLPLSPGKYHLWVGLYNPRTGERLLVPGTSDNRLLLIELEVAEG